MIPFPQESFCSGSNSGSKPYLEGPKSADCVLIKNTAAHSIGRLRIASPAIATPITTISISFVPITTLRLP
jgi:hypothetical protein